MQAYKYYTDGKRTCALSNVRLDGLGRGQIEYRTFDSNGTSIESKAYFPTLKGQKGMLKDLHVARQVLALPIAAKIINDESYLDDMKIPINNAGLNDAYVRYSKIVKSGDTGFNEGVIGFSVDFLELKTNDAINDFLKRRSVELAAELQLIDPSINTIELAEQVRQEVLYLINNDADQEYGSIENINATLALKYGGATTAEELLSNVVYGGSCCSLLMSLHFFYSIDEANIFHYIR